MEREDIINKIMFIIEDFVPDCDCPRTAAEAIYDMLEDEEVLIF